MKNLITAAACLLLLLAFLVQIIENQKIYIKITNLDEEVNNFKEVIKQDGCITGDNEKRMIGEISRILNCNPQKIKIKGDKKPMQRGELIRYQVEVPIENVIANREFWGIPKDYDKINYVVKRNTTSEYIGI